MQASSNLGTNMDTPRIGVQSEEGNLTRQVENQTSRAPSMAFLTLAVGSIGASALMALQGRRELANFIGLWAPTILIMGLYNKLVKVEKEIGHSYH